MRLAILTSRVRVEEKLLVAALKPSPVSAGVHTMLCYVAA